MSQKAIALPGWFSIDQWNRQLAYYYADQWYKAECNLCDRRVTYGELWTGEAILNSVGECWHKACEG